VSLGGCTASFVSPDGLIVTNHHCVTGQLQFNSTSNYLFDPILTRSIHVDARYMLWTMTEVDGATNLIRELGIK
jgi:hypothetical protein